MYLKKKVYIFVCLKIFCVYLTEMTIQMCICLFMKLKSYVLKMESVISKLVKGIYDFPQQYDIIGGIFLKYIRKI